MRHGHTGYAIELLNSACGPVCKQQRQCCNQCCNDDAISEVIGCSDNQRAYESKVPEIPYVHIERARPAHQQEDDVDQNTNWNNQQAHG